MGKKLGGRGWGAGNFSTSTSETKALSVEPLVFSFLGCVITLYINNQAG